MKLFNKKYIFAFFTYFLTTYGFAENLNMVNSFDSIQGLDKAIHTANKSLKIMVEFPTMVPKPTKKYFAYYEKSSHQTGFFYMISIDSTADCHGVKFCNIGMVSARKSEHPEMMKDKNDKEITVPVKLADGTDAYYTPGHAMGDYFPASIQYIDNKVLYTINWNPGQASESSIREALISMANSAKHTMAG